MTAACHDPDMHSIMRDTNLVYLPKDVVHNALDTAKLLALF